LLDRAEGCAGAGGFLPEEGVEIIGHIETDTDSHDIILAEDV
jgi:hypothetical protein